ncbi:MAG: NrfJ [Nitrosomonas sp.]|nr:NrfJ [Nitrosomonas sp.]
MLRKKFATIIIALSMTMSALAVQAESGSAALPSNEGIVVSSIDTAGYTYIELTNNGKAFWIAAPTTKVKNGDHLRFVESMSMHNFTSKTLNRTFDRVIFVTSTQVRTNP